MKTLFAAKVKNTTMRATLIEFACVAGGMTTTHTLWFPLSQISIDDDSGKISVQGWLIEKQEKKAAKELDTKLVEILLEG